MSKKLSIGIVGLPNVGKSTLFNLLTKQQVLAANYPFATIDPNVGIVPVPDERLDTLSRLSQSKKTIPAVVEFYDIAGLVKGASQGEGLGNQFLTHIRETQIILLVLRIFNNPDVIHVEESVNPERDLDIITTELMLKDLETVEKRLSSIEKEARAGNKDAASNQQVLVEIKSCLEKGETILRYADKEIVQELQLLSAKKQLCLLNGKEDEVSPELLSKLKEKELDYIVLDLGAEGDLKNLITKSYTALGLISFFTSGEEETRAWTIKQGMLAPQAAGEIHSDFESKFIRAEVVSYDKFVETGGWKEAKQKGRMRVEGKEYEVQNGDVMMIRHG